MPDYEVIAAVSETLQSVLTDALSILLPGPPPIAQMNDLLQNVPTNPAQLTIFLFEVGEDPSARNRPRVRSVTPPDVTLRKPPMALLLKYLLTPHSGDPETDQKMLGRVLQVLYDEAILSGPVLRGVLQNTDQALKITLAPLSLEERTRVWYSIQRPYRLSVSYEVRVVNLDSIRVDQITPVSNRLADFAVPEVNP